VEIRPVDVYDDAELTRYHEVARAAALHGRPDGVFWGDEYPPQTFRQDEPGEEITPFACYVDDVMAGCSFLLLTTSDNTEKAWIDVNVTPEHRGRGIGSLLLGHLLDLASQAGRTVAICQTYLPFEAREDHPDRRFLEQRGFVEALCEVRRDLDLPVPADRIATWVTAAARHHVGYSVQTHHGPIPDDCLASYVDLVGRLAVEAPGGALDWEVEALTPDEFRRKEENADEAGLETITTLARTADGTVVAYSGIGVRRDDHETAYQGGTLVHCDHRGHRLGLAVKAGNLLAFQQRYARCRRVVTTNAEVNRQMVAINELMGFRPVELQVEFARPL